MAFNQLLSWSLKLELDFVGPSLFSECFGLNWKLPVGDIFSLGPWCLWGRAGCKGFAQGFGTFCSGGGQGLGHLLQCAWGALFWVGYGCFD